MCMYVFGWAGAYKERCGDGRDGRSYGEYNKATAANTATIGIVLNMVNIETRAANGSPIHAFLLKFIPKWGLSLVSVVSFAFLSVYYYISFAFFNICFFSFLVGRDDEWVYLSFISYEMKCILGRRDC